MKILIAIFIAFLGIVSTQNASATWCVASAGSQVPTAATCNSGTYASQGAAQSSVNCGGWLGYVSAGANWGYNKCNVAPNNGYYYTFADSVSCPAGQKKQPDGSCVDICPKAGTVKSTGFFPLGTNENASVPTSTCDSGCATSYTGAGLSKRAMVNGVYNYWFGSGSYSYTGSTCSTGTASPSPGNVPPNTCDPATQSTGQVNGVTVCLPKTDTNTSNTTTSPTTTDPSTGNTSQTSNTTTNNTTNNTSTNITTTTTTAPDGTVTQSQTSTTTKTPPSNFCQANPTDPTCLKNSDACEKNPETLGCATLGTVTDSVVPTVEKGISSITPKSIGGAGGCPAPVTTSFMGQSISFSYDLPCQAAGMLKPLILAIAWLIAGIIFIGGVRQ